MLTLYARNPKQLDICLRLLYAEKIQFFVDVRENAKGKIFYEVSVLTNEIVFQSLKEKYRVMTA